MSARCSDLMDQEHIYWFRTVAQPSLAALRHDLSCEVVIIGAGYTGCAAALHLAEAGQDVVVLERHAPGWGCSGRNTGNASPIWHAAGPDQVRRIFGADAGKALCAMLVQAARQLLPSLLERHGIVCDYRNTGVIIAARSEESLAHLRDVARQWADYDNPVEVLEGAALQQKIATAVYPGGIWFRATSYLNPYAYALGLARAATAAGARLFAPADAVRLERQNDRWVVHTRAGHKVRARRVLIATGGYADGLWPGLSQAFYPVTVAMTAAAPNPALHAALLPGGVPFYDDHPLANLNVAFASDHSLIMGVVPPLTRRLDPGHVAAAIERRLRKVFPQVGQSGMQPQWRQVWYGTWCQAADSIPRLFGLAPGLFAIAGYSGYGVVAGTAMGAEVAKLIAAGDPDACAAPVCALQPAPWRRIFPAAMRWGLNPLARQVLYRL